MKRRKFFLEDNKLLIKFFQWLYFSEQFDRGTKIVKLRGFNTFLCDSRHGRETISPVWDKNRFKALYKRLRGIKEE